jgi:tripartite-type tricarboxylate transporter receptor subunit TctC
MNMNRRQFFHLTAGVAVQLGIYRFAGAQAYPSRPVRIVVGFPAGGPVDMAARLMGQWLSERLGQPFVIENRPGAGGNIGTEVVVKSPPDGYTLLLCGPVNTINTTLYDKLNFNFTLDIAPVASIARVPLVMEVNPSISARTVPEFISYAKAHPGTINFASGGNGTPHHVAGELFKMMAGVNMVHVPYRGSAPALTDLIGGQVQVMFDPMPSSIEFIKTGKLRPLAVTTATRSPAMPEIPTVSDSVPGFEAYSWYGIGAPKGTQAEIVDALNREVNAGLADPKMKARLADMGAVALPGSPTDFGALIAAETEKWRKVIRAANIRLE